VSHGEVEPFLTVGDVFVEQDLFDEEDVEG
jgi:hypothetical protein